MLNLQRSEWLLRRGKSVLDVFIPIKLAVLLFLLFLLLLSFLIIQVYILLCKAVKKPAKTIGEEEMTKKVTKSFCIEQSTLLDLMTLKHEQNINVSSLVNALIKGKIAEIKEKKEK